MAKITSSLFGWQEVEAKSDLARLKMVLEYLPDERFMQELEAERGRGRNDYPVRCVWNAILAGVVYQHDTIEKLRRELQRNAELRQLCGFDVFLGSESVPKAETFSRFFRKLIEHREAIEQIFDEMVEEIGKELPDYGKRTALDSKAIGTYGKPNKNEKEDGRRDLDADWGVKEYKGKRLDGSEWRTIKKWFGYKLHLLIDSKYELPLAYQVTKASASDVKQMRPIINEYNAKHSQIGRRTQYLTADKAYDDTKEIKWLYDERRIHPVIDIRSSWRKEGNESMEGEPQCRQLSPYKTDNIVYDNRGGVYCVCLKTLKYQAMAFGGYEAKQQRLKYICPVKAYGMSCQGMSECTHRCKSIWIKISKDRRIFTPIARSSYKWAREYRHRTAVERVNSRLDVSFGFEQHTIRGMAKMKARVGIAMIVMLAMALGHIKEKRREMMRSLVRSPTQHLMKKAA